VLVLAAAEKHRHSGGWEDRGQHPDVELLVIEHAPTEDRAGDQENRREQAVNAANTGQRQREAVQAPLKAAAEADGRAKGGRGDWVLDRHRGRSSGKRGGGLLLLQVVFVSPKQSTARRKLGGRTGTGSG